jgi:acetyltransferase-like isoleucine patch superfamily enzyme
MNSEDLYISNNATIKRPGKNAYGKHSAIDDFVYCTVELSIGDYVHISSNVSIIGGENAKLKMHHFSGISTGTRVICASDEMKGEGLVGPVIPEQYKDKIINKEIIFEEFATVGANVVLLPGVRLGQGSIVGANSLVSEDTKPWKIYIGNPAKEIAIRKKENIIKYSVELGYKIDIKD